MATVGRGTCEAETGRRIGTAEEREGGREEEFWAEDVAREGPSWLS